MRDPFECRKGNEGGMIGGVVWKELDEGYKGRRKEDLHNSDV